MIRLLLTGDLHTNVPRRSEEARRIAYWIVNDGRDRGVHFIGIGGDVIDGPMTEKDRDWLIGFGDYCASIAPTLFLMGNHEPELSLRCLRGRQTKFPLIVEEAAGIHVVETAEGPIAVAAVAYPLKAKLLAAIGRPASVAEADEVAGRALQDVFRGLGVKVRELGLPTAGLIHGTIRGSKISKDQPDRPLGLDIDMVDLDLMGAEFVCAPHIHLANQFKFNGFTAATPTSPFFTDFGEAHQEKGYILLNFELIRGFNERGRSWQPSWERISTPATPMLLFEANYHDGKLIWQSNESFPIMSAKPLPDPEELAKGADIRFRYRFPSDQRKTAVRLAEETAEKLRAAGAVNVTLDPVVTPVTRARIPELAFAPRLEDKLDLYWKSIGFEPTPERATTLRELLRELQEQAKALGVDTGGVGRTAPTLNKARLRGFMKFRGEVSADFTAMAGPLTAIIAPNEMGKTLFMQLIGPGALYGKTADRGSLDDLSVATDSFVQVDFDMAGANYVLTQNANGKDRKGHVGLVKNKVTELSKAGRAEYKEWALKNLLPQSVYDAVICQSGTDSVIDLDEAPRVELLVRVLGLEIYEVLAQLARDRASAATSDLAESKARAGELGDVDIEGLRTAATELKVSVDEAQTSLTKQEELLEAARSKAGAAEKERSAYEVYLAQLQEAKQQETQLSAQLSALETRKKAQSELLAEKPVIDQAAVQMKLLENEAVSRMEELRQYSVELEAVTGALNVLREQAANKTLAMESGQGALDSLLRTEAALHNELAALAELQDQVSEIKGAVEKVSALDGQLSAARTELTRVTTEKAEIVARQGVLNATKNGFTQREAEIKRRFDATERVLSGKAAVLDAVNGVRMLESEIELQTATVARYKEEVEALRASLSSVKDRRIKVTRTGLEDISTGAGGHPQSRALAALEEDADIVAEAEDEPGRLGEVQQAGLEANDRLGKLWVQIGKEKSVAALLPEIETAEREQAELNTALASVAADRATLKLQVDALVNEENEKERWRLTVAGEIDGIEIQLAKLKPIAARAADLAGSATKIEMLHKRQAEVRAEIAESNRWLDKLREEAQEISRQIDVRLIDRDNLKSKEAEVAHKLQVAEGEIAKLRPTAERASAVAQAQTLLEEIQSQISSVNQELVALGLKNARLEKKEPPEPVDMSVEVYGASQARERLTDLQTQHRVALKELRDAEAKDGRRQELAAQVRALEETVANCTLMGQHLGKKGLQSEEISVAGPTLTSLTNDLLRTAGDLRHTVSIETERLHSNKKDVIPCLEIQVYDSEEGITKESRRLSAAGKLLVGEPLSLAMVILGCQHAGIKSPTIFRDEATGVFDSTNAPRYIGMLRRFAEILDARVLFISQQPSIQELADSTITIDNGKLSFA